MLKQRDKETLLFPYPQENKNKAGGDFEGEYSVGSLHTTAMPPQKRGNLANNCFWPLPQLQKPINGTWDFLGGRCLVWKERQAGPKHKHKLILEEYQGSPPKYYHPNGGPRKDTLHSISEFIFWVAASGTPIHTARVPGGLVRQIFLPRKTLRPSPSRGGTVINTGSLAL